MESPADHWLELVTWIIAAVFGVVGYIVFFVWLPNRKSTAIANDEKCDQSPLKMRSEVQILDQDEWASIADAAARFYSMLSQQPALVKAKGIFEIESKAKQQDGPVWALRKYIWDYASNPILEVRGYVKGGASLVYLPKIEEEAVNQWIWDADVHANPESNANEIVLPNGQEITSLEVSYTSVNRMIDHLKGQAMKNLRDARKSDAIDEFVKEHESDPEGDLDKLDAVFKRPTQGTAKATPKASPQGSSDD